MKEKEEDEERNENICLQRTDNQTNREQSLNSKTEATLILCGSSGERANIVYTYYVYVPILSNKLECQVSAIYQCDSAGNKNALNTNKI